MKHLHLGARAHDYPENTPDTLFERMSADGFEAAQLAPKKSFGMGWPLSDDGMARIAKALGDHGIRLAVLGCYVELSAADEGERAAAVRSYQDALHAARVLGAHCVGSETTRCSREEDRGAAFDRLTDSVKRITECAARLDVCAAIEPVAVHTLSTIELTRELLDRVNGGSHLKIILDPINLLTAETVGQQKELYERAARTFGSQIAALHIKDGTFVNGAYRPCALGEGIMNFDALRPVLTACPDHVYALREELNPDRAQEERAFMRDALSL